MSRRALEVGAAIAAWQSTGGQVIFQTLTMRHHKGQSLKTLWESLSYAWGAVTNSRRYRANLEVMGSPGFIRAVEVTTGDNGWHVHIHALIFVGPDVDQEEVDTFAADVFGAWSRALQRRGLDAPRPVGQLSRLVTGPADLVLAEYFTKATDRLDPRRLGLELTHSQGKTARKDFSTRPVWDLLSDVEDHGDADALDAWHEWERISKGKRALTWSQGLRELLNVETELTDEEIAAEDVGDEDLVFITAVGWDTVIARPHLIPQILDAADVSPEQLRAFLIRHGIEFVLPS